MSQIEIQSCSDQLKFISCIAIDKYIVCGGYDGTVHVLQVQSNASPIINNNETMQLNSKSLQYATLLSYQAHKVMILNLDTLQNTVVSAALDGSIYCYQIDTNQIYQLQLTLPIKGIQLYGQSFTSTSFISKNIQPSFLYTVENKLMYNTSTLLTSNKNVVYLEELNDIDNLLVFNKFVVTCNPNQIHIYLEKQLLLQLEKPIQSIPLLYMEEGVLLIGWKHYLAMYSLTSKVDLIFDCLVEFMICGVGMLKQQIVLLGYPDASLKEQGIGYSKINQVFDFSNTSQTEDSPHNSLPVIALFNPIDKVFDQVFALNIPDYKSIRPNEYKFIVHHQLFAMTSPQSMLIGQPTTLENQISLLLRNNMVKDAMQLMISKATLVKQPLLLTHSKTMTVYAFDTQSELAHDVGILYINQLIENQCFEEAAYLLQSILTPNEYILYYNQFKQKPTLLLLFTSILPIHEALSDLYSLIIHDLLINQHDDALFILLQQLPASHYPTKVIQKVIQDHILGDDSDNTILLQCLAHLYTLNKQHDLLIQVYLKLHMCVPCFTVIAEYPYLIKSILSNNKYCIHYFELLEDINQQPSNYVHLLEQFRVYLSHPKCMIHQVGYLLIIKECHIPTLVAYLKNHNTHLFGLLLFLFRLDHQNYPEYHSLLVELALLSNNKHHLMYILRNTSHYALQPIAKQCERLGYSHELFYLYGRMGNSKGAIKIIVEVMQDYKLAVEYCTDLQDKEMWDLLIQYAANTPTLWELLLTSDLVFNNTQPVDTVIAQIPDTLPIPHLKNKLQTILDNHSIEHGLSSGCSEIMINDCLLLFKGYRKHTCQSTWIHPTTGGGGEYLVFGCGHCYLRDQTMVTMMQHSVNDVKKPVMKRRPSLSSISSTTSTIRKFTKATQYLKTMTSTEQPLQIECPICLKKIQ